MTPQERQLVDELFDKLARLERNPRDRDAEGAIDDGLQRAPNAVYALVQTVLVQDEALKRADARIRELSGEGEPAQSGGGFLDTMRAALGGGSSGGGASRGSVPSVRAGAPDTRWNTGGGYAQQAAPQPQAAPQAAPPVGSGSSFLGTAAASAAGAIGGALLMNSISSMFSHRGGSGQAFAGEQSSGSPWSDNNSNSDLSRDAGLNDVGSGGRGGGNDRSAGLFGSDNDDNDDNDNDTDDVADSGDFGGDDGGGDTA